MRPLRPHHERHPTTPCAIRGRRDRGPRPTRQRADRPPAAGRAERTSRAWQPWDGTDRHRRPPARTAAPTATARADQRPRSRRANGQERSNGCTAPQLRRFIKSRPYVPMHELRRRFAIDGGDDDVTQVSIEQGNVYVGLPSREGSLLGELLRGGEIGYELSLDPRTPVVVGVYPMRPIPRS